jgi:hypothetical protein
MSKYLVNKFIHHVNMNGGPISGDSIQQLTA